MKKYEFGNLNADIILIQPVDEYDLAGMENEVSLIASKYGNNFRLIAIKIDNWNNDLSPWKAPAVFGKEDFGEGAKETLNAILKLCTDQSKKYYIGGYSLAGLFALWAAFQTDIFKGVAVASPSMWFPGFTDYMKENEIKTSTVYLSLGDKEEKARNIVMATVGDRIKEAYDFLSNHGVKCILEWNEGNHFKNPDVRTAKAFAWVMNDLKRKC